MKNRMLRGDLYFAGDPELVADRARAAKLLERYNQTHEAERDERGRLLHDLLGEVEEGAVIMPISPPWYRTPRSLDDLVAAFTGKLLALLGEDAGPGWREEDLE